MQFLGFPLTYPTRCFIAGGCGAHVYAHTNGYCDFVLFDDLGQPWPVHSCYRDLFGDPNQNDPTPAPDAYTNQERAQEVARRNQAYKDAAREASLDRHRRPVREIVKASPACLDSPIRVCGYVQNIIEQRGANTLRSAGTLGQQVVGKSLGFRQTQLTIINSDFKSYTGFADLRQTVLARGSTVVARLRPTEPAP